jgi:hypothetical protein
MLWSCNSNPACLSAVVVCTRARATQIALRLSTDFLHSSPYDMYFVFDIWTEREERVTLCLWRAYVLVLIKIKLCYTDSITLTKHMHCHNACLGALTSQHCKTPHTLCKMKSAGFPGMVPIHFHVKYSICAVQSNPGLNSGIFIFALFFLFQTQKLCLALLQYQVRRVL